MSSTIDGANRPEATARGDFTFLDQALWKQFREADTPESFTRAWLALQCRLVGDASCGVVVLGEPEIGPFAPAAYWPDEGALKAELSATAEQAMAERQGVVRSQGQDSGGGKTVSVAYPLTLEGQLFGVVAMTLGGARSQVRNVMRQLQWGAAWMELLLRRQQSRSDGEERQRTAAAFDLLAAVLEQERFQDACNALVTELAMRLECDPVSVGFLRRGRTLVKAISHAADFGRRMNLIRDIGVAMDEAMDQKAVVLYPANEDWDYRVTRAHAELAATHKAGSILTIPLQAGGKVFGAITFERPAGAPFDEATVELCDAAASLVGPILYEKKRNDRLILTKVAESIRVQLKRLLGPHYFGRKLATVILVALVAFFSLASDDYRVTSPAVLEGSVQRTIVAPFDGYLASQHARAGETVAEGEVLATLDDRDLVLERLRWSTSRSQHLTEYDRAFAERNRAEANIHRAEIEQAEAQIALLDEQLARTRIKAPFHGIVVSGDLSQSVGATVHRGEELFKIAPLDSFRVILEVDETDVEEIGQGQTGTLRLSSLPDELLDFTVERITPIAEQAEGRNYFRVEAGLDEADHRLRPGMEGVAKTLVEERLLIRIWTDKLVDWLRLALWRWMP